MRKVSILGSTGSIGTQALDVIRNNREKFEVTALACGQNLELLSEQIKEFAPKIAVIESAEDAKILNTALSSSACRATKARKSRRFC